MTIAQVTRQGVRMKTEKHRKVRRSSRILPLRQLSEPRHSTPLSDSEIRRLVIQTTERIGPERFISILMNAHAALKSRRIRHAEEILAECRLKSFQALAAAALAIWPNIGRELPTGMALTNCAIRSTQIGTFRGVRRRTCTDADCRIEALRAGIKCEVSIHQGVPNFSNGSNRRDHYWPSKCISMGERGKSMPSVFALWVGQPVVLQVAAESFCVPLRGMIVGESESCVLFRVEEGREEIGIEKIMILAIEQDLATSVLVN